jgi:predicted phage tail protein
MPRGRPRRNPEDALMKSAEFIGWALGGLEREIAQTRERLSALTDQASRLRARMSNPASQGESVAAAATFDEPGAVGTRRRRRMSAEARRRISEMMKKRWAERRKKQLA